MRYNLINYIIAAILAISAFNLNAQALDTPQISCITVDAAGNVAINWTQPPDPGGIFFKYNLQASNDGGVIWNPLGNLIDYNTTSFIHVGIDANIEQWCYRVNVESNGGIDESPFSDIRCSILLSVDQSNPIGFADLSWEGPYLNEVPVDDYFIYVEDPPGQWNLVTSVPGSVDDYSYEVIQCAAILNFQITQDEGLGCIYQSNIAGDVFADETAPPTPTITTASVDPITGNSYLEWEVPGSSDVSGYFMYTCEELFGSILETLVDSVLGGNVTTWEYPNSNAFTGSECFRLASHDDCFTTYQAEANTSPTQADCHCTIFTIAIWNPCDDFISIEWEPYQGWPNGVSYYEIWYTEDNGPETYLTAVDGNVLDFVHEDANIGSTYIYWVIGFAEGLPYQAVSNRFTRPTDFNSGPDYTYISSASVVCDNEVDVRMFLTPTLQEFAYYLERKDGPNSDWKEIDIRVDNLVNFLEFNDPDVDTDEQSFDYRILTLNECGDTLRISNIGSTIYVSGLANTNSFVNTVTWTPYSEWDGNVVEYRIYRTIEEYQPETLIATVPGSQLFYEDNVNDLIFTEGEFCYRIEAVESMNSFGFAETASSNCFCLVQEPKIWIPNAIVVNGFNPVFFPVISFADFDNYKMIIYNRWGTEIFTTEDIAEGWDATYEGSDVPEGQYMYYISVSDGQGNAYERKGRVVVLFADDE